MRFTAFLLSVLPILILSSALIPITAEASASPSAARLQVLAEHPDWQNLLHIPKNGNTSEIENQSFFVADNGRTNAHAELIATLALFASDHPDTADHPQCRYPARFFWLQNQGLLENVAAASCSDFKDWAEVTRLESSSLIFADGFLGNPASFYGHLLLKNNTHADNFGADLLNNSLNFGASVADDENPVVYILKGLFGGYQATYSASHFYRYNLNYSEAELRDLWEYELNVTAEQAYLLAAHNWELLNTAYTYYFTHRNCAYHLGRTLELVLDEPIMSRNEPFVFPIAVVDRLVDSTITGEPAVKGIRHIESRQSRFRHKFLQLTELERSAAEEWVDSLGLEQSTYLNLTDASKARVVTVLIDYYEFLISQNRADESLKQLKNQVLLARMRLPAGAVAFSPSAATPPHEGMGGSMLRPHMIHNSEFGAGFDFTYRIAYYDMLTPDAGKAPNSALSMGELSLRWHEHRDIEVAKLWAVNIESMNINPTGLSGDGGRAWMLRGGWERNYLADAGQDLRFFVRGGLGKAWHVGSARLYAMVDAQINERDERGNEFALMPKLGFTYAFAGDQSKVRCETQFQQGNASNQWGFRCDARVSHGDDWDIRLGVAREDYTEGYMGISLYW
ncbi:hypothetical protein CWE08_09585 [Aliidiomarina iranensis]|uniref:Uncharacterized protein n=1 Tax=Aliidiomarina iranensis TaxID=1434071 RepID=A0A432VTC2_9GAMM|nr:DUF4105 domain-containing protein [Aliidiomarina iranensis]RUO19672.1 hypothetical protein CWE08_09585 [Aliidiomarina iranensis]